MGWINLSFIAWAKKGAQRNTLTASQITISGGGKRSQQPGPSNLARKMSYLRKSSIACLECGKPMMTCRYDSIEVDRCRHCNSYWLDMGEMRMLTRLSQDIPGMRFKSRPSAYQCPSCTTAMTEYQFTNPGNLLIDRCDSCGGIYCENQELERAMQVKQG